MLGRSAGALAASALTASAFLIPAGIEPVTPGHNDVDWMADSHTGGRLVRLPCSACVFQTAEEVLEDAENDIFRITGGAHDVILNYTLAEDGNTLLMNGAPVFRMGDGVIIGYEAPAYYVEQVPASAAWSEIMEKQARSTSAEITGAGFSTTDVIELKNGAMVAQLRASIHQISDGQHDIPVHLDAVLLDLAQPKDSKLMILGMTLETRPQTGLPPPPYPKNFFDEVPGVDDQPVPLSGEHEHSEAPPLTPITFHECKSLPPPICRLKHLLASKFRGMRKGGCPGRMGSHPGARPHNGMLPSHIKAPSFPRPQFEQAAERFHHTRPHGAPHHGHHHRMHFLHAVARGIASILIPTMMGVAVGMTVSLVGLAVGRLISFLWITVVRGGRRGYASVALEDDVAVEGEMEKGLFEEEEEREPLPMYEDAPAYEETEKEGGR